ncbi:MAG: hypothetical protein K6G33_06855 [Ruminococcus sp.]|uniref:hypothetical protein n=1 Tax=Ruminococcus sp. TaxID=41978 RepID=UPI0025DBD525|nr:hypothetical protein [Ruminococcus sp.]MCR5600439.1 hypothetical protein [Ruminococcus sp.]
MKFRIKHTTPALCYGTIIPWFIAIAALLLFVFLDFTINDKYPTIIFGGILALCLVVDTVFVLLLAIEKIFGTKIIVEADHIKIHTLLRRRKIYYDNISDVKYSHYECSKSRKYRKDRSSSLLYKLFQDDEDVWIRAQLTIYPVLGKVIELNDDAANYEQKRKRWITDPHLDPDEDVKLYQAYLCYKSAYRQYNNMIR